ncbi:MAG: glycerol-3-phosphate dehydrogenase/oxidase [Candidatus Lokiarchaeota archaeon]|nr:glycerol-3-phosphate dehydrogenase/oxidase [Candidatus Harpocratesius repetitus]
MSNSIVKIDWSNNFRQDHIKKLKSEEFELVIIGGGITGAGIAREAALRGIKTALIDMNDFAFGTSSRSSKLAHGGFRYLSQAEFKLVREATTERNWLRSHFSHNCRPLKMYMIADKKMGITPKEVKIGICLYDFLSNCCSKFKQYAEHKFYTKEEAERIQPNMRFDDLQMIGEYYDTNVDDARLTLETIKEAVFLGSTIAVNYVKADGFERKNGKIISLKVHDLISNEQFHIKGRHFINATGIWTDDLLPPGHRKVIRPTKGVHVAVPIDKIGNRDGIGLKSIDDGRVFFVLNREDITLIGTTDTDYIDKKNGQPNEDLAQPYCTKEDCDYLFHTVNYLFPKANLTYDDIISTYAGIRPLVMEEGKSESEVSRKHVILDASDGLTTLCGGKLTTYRKMAEDLLFHLFKKDPKLAARIPKKMKKKNFSRRPFLVNLSKQEWRKFLQETSTTLSEQILSHLYQQYGKGAKEIVIMVKNNSDLGVPLLSGHPFIPAEIEYIIEHEYIVHLVDILRRRTEIFMKVRHDQQEVIAEKVAKILAVKMKWDSERIQNEIQDYIHHIRKTIWF